MIPTCTRSAGEAHLARVPRLPVPWLNQSLVASAPLRRDGPCRQTACGRERRCGSMDHNRHLAVLASPSSFFDGFRTLPELVAIWVLMDAVEGLPALSAL